MSASGALLNALRCCESDTHSLDPLVGVRLIIVNRHLERR